MERVHIILNKTTMNHLMPKTWEGNRNHWCCMQVVLYLLNPELPLARSYYVLVELRYGTAPWTWCSTRIARAPLSEHGGGAEPTRSSTRSLFDDRPRQQQAEWSAERKRPRHQLPPPSPPPASWPSHSHSSPVIYDLPQFYSYQIHVK